MHSHNATCYQGLLFLKHLISHQSKFKNNLISDTTLQCQKFLTGLSLGLGAGDFPPDTMSMTPGYFCGKQKENETKRTP